MRSHTLVLASLLLSSLAALAAGAEITRVSPSVIPPDGGTLVTFFGDGFGRGDVPRINGVAMTRVSVPDAKRISGHSPALPPGTYTVDVRSITGAIKARLPDAITVEAPEANAALLERLRRGSRLPLVTSFRNGIPCIVTGRIAVSGGDTHAKSQDFLKRYGTLYGLGSPDVGLEVRRALDDEIDTITYQQTYQGLQVHGASLLLAFRGDELVFSLARLLLPAKPLETRPRVSQAEAESLARRAIERPGAPVVGRTQLVICDLGLLTDGPNDPQLAWRITLGRREPWRVFVAAGRGTILLKYELSQDSGGSTHGYDLDLQDAEGSKADKETCFDDIDTTSVATESWLSSSYASDADAVMARNAIKAAYQFYHQNFDQHSYNDDSSQLRVFIHATNKGGASWSPGCSLIQANTGRPSMDTLCHELTHGIIGDDDSSQLEYSFQSGALNEHYADAMACISDRMREGANADWTHAEDRTSGAGPVRYFDDPTQSSQPDHMSGLDFLWDEEAGEFSDNGGVHYNSGIANKALYLMIAGGSHGGFAAPGGLSLQKAGYIKWAALRHLPSTTSFYEARNFEVSIAELLVDNNLLGFTAQDVCAIKVAWAAVGVGEGLVGNFCGGVPIVDSDSDGVLNQDDNCDDVANPLQENKDLDFWGDACDSDIDNDGFANGVDTCPNKYNPPQGPCDDYDKDGVKDNVDNCWFDPNPDQLDTDGDGEGNACEVDTDGDGVNVPEDNCPVVPNTNQADTDGDHFGDACDKCPNTADPVWAYGFDGNPFQPDSDEDGVPDACDNLFIVDGIAGLPLAIGGKLSRVEIDGAPGKVVTIPIDICPDGCPEWYRPGPSIDLDLGGLGPDILAYLTDENGNNLSRTVIGRGEDKLRMKPQGGGKYALVVEFGPRYRPAGMAQLAVRLFENLTPDLPPSFRRGDANGDGKVDLSDAVRSLSFLFLGTPAPGCLDAADANDDNRIDLSDGVFPLSVLFLGQGQLPDPGSEQCGQDPTTSIGCAVSGGCGFANRIRARPRCRLPRRARVQPRSVRALPGVDPDAAGDARWRAAEDRPGAHPRGVDRRHGRAHRHDQHRSDGGIHAALARAPELLHQGLRADRAREVRGLLRAHHAQGLPFAGHRRDAAHLVVGGDDARHADADGRHGRRHRPGLSHGASGNRALGGRARRRRSDRGRSLAPRSPGNALGRGRRPGDLRGAVARLLSHGRARHDGHGRDLHLHDHGLRRPAARRGRHRLQR
jgi:Zn-dependent metalloprotease